MLVFRLLTARLAAFAVLIISMAVCRRVSAESDAEILCAWQERYAFVTGQAWTFPAWDDPGVPGTTNPAPVMPDDDYAAAKADAAIDKIFIHIEMSGSSTPLLRFAYLTDYYLTSEDLTGLNEDSIAKMRVSLEARYGVTGSAKWENGRGKREFLAGIIRNMRSALRPVTIVDHVRRAWYDPDAGSGEIPSPDQTVTWSDTNLIRFDPAGWNETGGGQSSWWCISGKLKEWAVIDPSVAAHVPFCQWQVFGRPSYGGANYSALIEWFQTNVGATGGFFQKLPSGYLGWPAGTSSFDPAGRPATFFGAGIGQLYAPAASIFGTNYSDTAALTSSSPILSLNCAVAVGTPRFKYLPSAEDCGCSSCAPGDFNPGSTGPSGDIPAGTGTLEGEQPKLSFELSNEPAGGLSPEITPNTINLPDGTGGADVIRRTGPDQRQVISGDTVSHVAQTAANEVTIKTLRKSQAGTPDMDGWYPDVLTETPDSVIVVKQSGTAPGVIVEYERGAHERTFTWQWSATPGWTMTDSRGKGYVTKVPQPAVVSGKYAQLVPMLRKAADGTSLEKVETKYVLFDRGWQIAEQTADADSTARKTTWDYYGEGDGAGLAGQVKSVGAVC